MFDTIPVTDSRLLDVSCEYVGCKHDIWSSVCAHVRESPNCHEVFLHVHYLLRLQARLVWIFISSALANHWRSQCMSLVHVKVFKDFLGVCLLM